MTRKRGPHKTYTKEFKSEAWGRKNSFSCIR